MTGINYAECRATDGSTSEAALSRTTVSTIG